jgi:hypothetical protein
MRQFWALVAVMGLGGLTACGGNTFQSGAPTARLSAPACVVQGATVVLDASKSTDPDGKLVRFIFSLGEGKPDYVSDTPRLNHVFEQALVVDGGYLPYHLGLTVVDDDGNYSSVLNSKLLYVVRNEAHCPTLQEDVLEADLVFADAKDTLDSVPGDTAPVDTTAVDTTPVDTTSPDTTPLDTVAIDTTTVDSVALDTVFEDMAVDTAQPEDTLQPDTTTSCTNLAGKWHVTTRRDGIKQLEMDIDLYQTECAVTTDGGFLKGNIAGDGTLNIDSNIPALHMENCSGPAAKPAFSVSCDADGDGGVWTADFLAK